MVAGRDVLVTKASSWGDASATAGTSVQYPDQARTALAAAAAGGAGGMGHQPQVRLQACSRLPSWHLLCFGRTLIYPIVATFNIPSPFSLLPSP
jgi:hypothetical protein